MLLAVSQSIGLETGDTPRIASGFGGGVGGVGSLCGALVGAVMAVGLKHGRSRVGDDPGAVRTRSQKILRDFRGEMGSDLCLELTGMDISTPEGAKAFHDSDVPERVCRICVLTAARLAEQQLAP